MKLGDFVKFGFPNGSIGQIESANHYGDFYVKWVYGRDNLGEVVTAISSCRPEQLITISCDEYNQAKDRKFNST